MISFPTKQITLIDNVPSSLVWNNYDFRASLNTDIIEKNVTITFQVNNRTANVLYLGIAYQTKTRNYALGERKSIAAVPPNTTLLVSSKTVSSLVRLEQDVVSISLELSSASGGLVEVVLGIAPYDGSIGSGGFSPPNIGYDTTSVRDEIFFTLQQQTNLESGDSFTETHTVTAGKRCIVSSIGFIVPITPYQWGDIYVQLRAPNGKTITINSSPFSDTVFNLAESSVFSGESGQLFELEVIGQNPIIGKLLGFISLVVVLKEYL